MSRRQKEPLRTLREEEVRMVEVHCPVNPRAGQSHDSSQATLSGGRGPELYPGRAGDRATVRRCSGPVGEPFNREGVQALERRGGAGSKPTYGTAEREQILAVVRRCPEPEADGTATWSLTLLQRALHRQAPQSLGRISTYTIWAVLHEAGMQWGRARSWCETGHARRKRKSGVVTVVDPDAEAKKS
jgi:Homeodomain-like domain